MNAWADAVVLPGLVWLAAWSIRWGLLIAALAILFRVRPPKRAVTRHCLATAVLVTGLILPLIPRWETHWVVARPTRAQAVASQTIALETRTPPPSHTIENTPSLARMASSPRIITPVAPGEPRVPTIPDAKPITPPRRETGTNWGLCWVCLASIWMVGLIWRLSRLLVGWLALGRLRGTTLCPSETSVQLFGHCLREVGLRRRVRLMEHRDVLSPIALGGRNALILVPVDWDDLDPAARRACLLHELSHLERRDDLARLAREILRAPFFFHPLVAWLMDRLDREAERICDEAAVGRGVDPRDFARLLLAFARRGGRLRERGASRGRLVLAFFDRGSVVDRITRLLEDDMPRTISPLPTSRRIGLALVVATLALPLGSLCIRAVEADEPAVKVAIVKPEVRPVRLAKGVVRDGEKQPIAGATVVFARHSKNLKIQRTTTTTDADGAFSIPLPDGEVFFHLLANKDGYSISSRPGSFRADAESLDELVLVLSKPVPFVATLVDSAGKPVAGAKVRAEAAAFETGPNSMSFAYYRPEDVAGTPLERRLEAITDDRGSFRLTDLSPGACPRLSIIDARGRAMRVARKMANQGDHLDSFGAVKSTPDAPPTLTLVPTARVNGRLVATLPGVKAAGRIVTIQSSREPGQYDNANRGEFRIVDEDGRFQFEGLFPGRISVSLVPSDREASWTVLDALATLESGKTAEVEVRIVAGLIAEGTVVSTDGTPIPDVPVRVCDAKSGVCGLPVNTDAKGRYTLRSAPGEQSFSIGAMVPGYSYGTGSSRTVTIPDDAATYTVPPLTLEKSAAVKGRIVDGQGKPIIGAKVIGVCDEFRCMPLSQPSSKTDANGRFDLADQNGGGFPVNRASSFQIELLDGKKFELKAVRDAAGEVTLKVATLQDTKVKGPEKVAPDELAGVVVDSQGKPIAGAEIAVHHWVPNYRTRSDAQGRFKFEKFDPGNRVEARVRKEGFETQFLMDKVVGEPGWVVVLGNTTYFEGRVRSPDGKPVAGALICADSGPRRGIGFMLGECVTETTSDKDGHYRLYVEPGQYDFQVRVAGVGVAGLPKQDISADQTKTLDIKLSPGINFVARTVDSQTGKPIAGVALSHWQKPGIEGTSDANGVIQIQDVPPGKYPRFEVKAKGYARFWSDACQSEWNRFQKEGFHGQRFQRNFDGLDFEITPGMTAVTIQLEKGVTIRGRVLNPDGKPVSGATVAPALTGSGNSLTGDTRFSVETDTDGQFDALLPASGEAKYNLLAHDGKYQEWRTWANGVLPPIRTKPGQVIEGVDLKLSRAGTVTGRVVDGSGNPVVGRAVRAEPTAKDENRYYDPTVKTGPDGEDRPRR